MTPRLVATDLDGTLVHSDGTITRRTAWALQSLERRGVPVVFVTGRPLRWAEVVFEHVGEVGLAIVSNGALVWDVHAKEVRMLRALAVPDALEVARRIGAAVPGTGFAVEMQAGFAFEPTYLERHPMPPGSVRGPLSQILTDQAIKLLARHEDLAAEEFARRAAAAVGDLAVVTWSSTGSSLLEISAPGVTKASTLARVCAGLGVAPEDVVAFGDMPNDIAMLTWAGTSYSMADAHPSVAAAAGNVAPAGDDDGVARVLGEIFALTDP